MQTRSKARKLIPSIFVLGALAASVGASYSAAEEIMVANPSFEEQLLLDGQYNINNMAGWVGSGTWWHVANPRNDWFSGTTAALGGANPVDGVNIAGINTGATIYQDLAATVQAGVSYKLSMLVGHRIGVPFGQPTVSLIAGGQVLAESVPSSPAEGTFAPYELAFDSPASGAVVGQTIRIQIRSAGLNAQPWLDNVKLSVGPQTPPPPPPTSDIVIANHSFEAQALPDGQYNVNNMTGWTGSGTYWHVANPGNSYFAGTSAGSAGSNPIDGSNVGGANTGATLYQDLSAVVQPAATYKLTMLVGHRIGVPFGLPVISLNAGGQVLAEAVPSSPAEGAFATFELTYDSPASGTVVGLPIRIQIKSVGANAQVWFDNLRLSVVPQTPPPPPPGPDIVIANHSFEAQVLPDGQYNVNNMTGWTGSGTYWHVANPANNYFTGTTAGSPQSNPIDGVNIAGINTGATIYQDLAATVQAGVSYKLSMLVGHRIGVPFGQPTVSLIAGGQVLAESVPSSPAEGTFAPYELAFDSPASGAVVGQTIRIQIRSAGLNAQPWLDNVKLSVGPQTPPPSPYLAISNNSFEVQVLADGQENVNDMAGWVGSGSFYHVSNPTDARFQGTSEGSSLPNPIDGVNIAGLNTGTTIYQDLTATVQAGVSYKLTMLVGHRVSVPFGSPVVSLLAGGQVLAQSTPAAPDEGKFSSFELTYDSPESGSVVGQALRIQITSAGIDAQPWFDNLQLAVGPQSPPPPPPVPGISIANQSFEQPALSDGNYTINNTPGWFGFGTWWHVANPGNDWFYGTSAGSSGPNPIDGANAAGLNTGATIYQDIAATVQPGVTYMLRMLVGHRLGVPFGRPTVSLIAGNQVLAESVPVSPADGRFASFELLYSSPESGSVIGKTLRIQISSTGRDAQPWFDNITLTVGPKLPPPPVNAVPVAKAHIAPLFSVWPEQTNLMVIAVDGYSAVVGFDGTLSTDADGDALSFYWSLDDEGSPFATTAVATNSLSTGLHQVALLVHDGKADNTEMLEIEVIGLADALDEIYGVIIESELLRKDKRPLLATLDGVMDAFEKGHLPTGAQKLHAFQQKVRAQVEGQFPDLARRLSIAAGQIITAVDTYHDGLPGHDPKND